MMTYARGRSGLRIGLLSITAALSFSALFFYSTNRVVGAARSTIYVRLNAADGLLRGDAVLHRGVNVGEVKAIEFSGDDVVVRVRLTRAVPVDRNAHAEMVAVDIFGRQSIVIHPGDGGTAALTEGDTIRGTGPVSMTARIEGLGNRVGKLLSDSTIGGVRETLHGAGRAVSTAATAASEIGDLARSAEAMIDEQRRALGVLTREAGLLVRDLRETADPRSLESLRGRLEASASNLTAATSSLDSASASVARILSGLESGHGSAGRLLTDDTLYQRVTGSVEALERLLEDVRLNPKRYLTVKVF